MKRAPVLMQHSKPISAIKRTLNQGIEQGIEQGRVIERQQIAQQMKMVGMAIAQIAQITGLAYEDVETL